MIKKILQKKEEFEDGLEGRERELWEVFVFLVRFTALVLPLYLLIWLNWDPVWLRSLDAGIASGVLDLLGVSASHTGTVFQTPTIAVDVSVDSTGWKSFLALSALIVAVRGVEWKERLIGILAGAVVVFAANIARLVSMVYAVEMWGISYELLHTLLWRWGLTVVVLGCWLAWMRWREELASLF